MSEENLLERLAATSSFSDVCTNPFRYFKTSPEIILR